MDIKFQMSNSAIFHCLETRCHDSPGELFDYLHHLLLQQRVWWNDWCASLDARTCREPCMAWGEHPADPLDDPRTNFGFLLKL